MTISKEFKRINQNLIPDKALEDNKIKTVEVNIKNRVVSLDFLRIVCCIAIIALHYSGFIYNHYKYWSLINTIVRPELWIFFMLSGYFLLENPINGFAKFYILRISKVCVATTIYSIIYQTAWDMSSIKSINQYIDLISFKGILSGQIPWAEHFWFVYAIIALYILTPFIGDLLRNISNKRFIIFIVIIFSFMSFPPLLMSYLNITLKINIYLANEPFFYFIFGYAILRLELYKYKRTIYISGAVCLILTYTFNFNTKLAANLYTSSINMMVLSVFIFVLFFNMKAINNSGRTMAKITSYISKGTFGVYLIHIFIMRHLPFPSVLTLTENNYKYQVIINIFAIFMISFIVSQIIDFFTVTPINYGISKLIKIYDNKTSKI